MKSSRHFLTIRHRISLLSSRKIFFDVHPEVQTAINERRPVVACETAILTHGLPRPTNVETCLKIEQIIRENGSTPATIGIIDGRIKVGLTEKELERLGSSDNVLKASRRDLAYLVSRAFSAGTTVAATMLIAHRCGISIFATGGVGGVHRDFQTTGDISSDLDELGRTPVCVVSSGVKSILDIPKTLEYLETKGVGVYTYGDSDVFPNFFTRTNEFRSRSCASIRSIDEAVKLVQAMIDLKLDSGLLLAVPIDAEDELQVENIEKIIQKSLRTAAQRGITGNQITPFVLAEIRRETGDQAIKTNQKLIFKNAQVASNIAANLFSNRTEHVSLTVVGARNIDIHVQLTTDLHLNQGSTLPCRIRQSLGGVAFNVTHALELLKTPSVRLLTVGGESTPLETRNLTSTSIERIPGENTASYISILDSKNNELICGLGDMQIYDRQFNDEFFERNRFSLLQSQWILFDANLTEKAMKKLIELANKPEKTLAFISAGGPQKAMRIRPFLDSISIVFCNKLEFLSIVAKENSIEKNVLDLMTTKRNLKLISVTMGADGVLIGFDGQVKHYRALKLNGNQSDRKQNVTGAGDSFAAGFLNHLLTFGWKNLDRAVARALLSAKFTLTSSETISEKLNTIDEKMIDQICSNELQSTFLRVN